MEGICEERRPPFADDVIRYYGQYVALAVADTFEAAKAAADAVRVTYDKEKPSVETDLEADDDPEVVSTTFGQHERLQSQRGDADAAFASAPVKIDQTYVTPAETHNPIELHATTAIWEGSTLTLYDSSQGVVNFRASWRKMFDLSEGERPRHHQVRWFGFRRQAVSMDALCARRRGGAASWASR